jgi:hypothetical protein
MRDQFVSGESCQQRASALTSFEENGAPWRTILELAISLGVWQSDHNLLNGAPKFAGSGPIYHAARQA